MRLTSAGLAALVALAIVPALVGSASAAPVSAASGGGGGVPDWAYGGEGWSSGDVSGSGFTVTWNASFGIDVIFNETNTSAHVTEIKVQRTVVLSLSASASNSSASVSYSLKAVENDLAYANLTNNANVTLSNGTQATALGLLNASASATASLDESISASVSGISASASFHAGGNARATVHLAPALGLIPLNLSALNGTAVTSWNSSAVATPASNWSGSYSYAYNGWNGTASGSGSFAGGWNTTGVVHLQGFLVATGIPHFTDHAARLGVLLLFSGPFDLYDGFVLIPHGFDFFGNGSHTYNASSFGSATIDSETVYASSGTVAAHSLTAARASYGAAGGVLAHVSASGRVGPAIASSSPGASVVAQPMTPSQARAQANCLQFGCGSSAGLGLLGALVIGLVAAVVAMVGALGWRARSRRRAQQPPAGGVGPWSPGGSVPSGAAMPPTPPSPPNLNEPVSPGDPNRPF